VSGSSRQRRSIVGAIAIKVENGAGETHEPVVVRASSASARQVEDIDTGKTKDFEAELENGMELTDRVVMVTGASRGQARALRSGGGARRHGGGRRAPLSNKLAICRRRSTTRSRQPKPPACGSGLELLCGELVDLGPAQKDLAG